MIHEAHLKQELAGESEKRWEDRAHFFGVAAKAMRHILVDHAGAKKAAKRGGEIRMVQLDEGPNISGCGDEIIALNDALDALGPTGQ